jgi:hypothetical protein
MCIEELSENNKLVMDKNDTWMMMKFKEWGIWKPNIKNPPCLQW